MVFLEAQYAVGCFLGKTVEEAEELLGNNVSLSDTDDLNSMGGETHQIE